MTPAERIYLAGPMTGIYEWNFPAFFTATEQLRQAGHIVCNPAERDVSKGFEWEGLTGTEDLSELGFDLRYALAYDLEWITTQATRVVVLPGWERSKGARAEVAAATAIGIEVHDVEAFLRFGIYAHDLTAQDPERGPSESAGIGSTSEALRQVHGGSHCIGTAGHESGLWCPRHPHLNVLKHDNGVLTFRADEEIIDLVRASASDELYVVDDQSFEVRNGWGELTRTVSVPAPVLPPIVGITGRKRSGKNTAADALVEMGYELAGFADELKEAALDLDPFVYDDCRVRRLSRVVGEFGWERAKDECLEVRRILQRLGTDVVRERDPEFWLRAFERRHLHYITTEAKRFVIADVRFDNEAQWVRDHGGIVIEILRPDLADDGDTHASEAGVSPELIDRRISNIGTVEELHQLARTCINARIERAA